MKTLDYVTVYCDGGSYICLCLPEIPFFELISMNLMFSGPCIILIVEQRETNLMLLVFLFPYLMLGMFRMLIHPSSGACDLFDELFHGLYCSSKMCVGVTLWFGWGGVMLYPDGHHPSQATT
jgi:hypothetical protein